MQEPIVAKRFLVAAALSFGILAVSTSWSVVVGNRANELHHEVEHHKLALEIAQRIVEKQKK